MRIAELRSFVPGPTWGLLSSKVIREQNGDARTEREQPMRDKGICSAMEAKMLMCESIREVQQRGFVVCIVTEGVHGVYGASPNNVPVCRRNAVISSVAALSYLGSVKAGLEQLR